MQDNTSSKPAGYCSNIKNLHQTARAQLETLEAERQKASQKADETQNALLETTDPVREPQLRAAADGAVREVQRIDAEVDRVKRQLEAYVNDYVISDCGDVLGPL